MPVPSAPSVKTLWRRAFSLFRHYRYDRACAALDCPPSDRTMFGYAAQRSGLPDHVASRLAATCIATAGDPLLALNQRIDECFF